MQMARGEQCPRARVRMRVRIGGGLGLRLSTAGGGVACSSVFFVLGNVVMPGVGQVVGRSAIPSGGWGSRELVVVVVVVVVAVKATGVQLGVDR